MRYLVYALISVNVLFVMIASAYAAPPKDGDVRETIYVCKTVEALNRVLSAKGEEAFNVAADAAVAEGKCIKGAFDLKVVQPLDTYHPDWALLVFHTFSTVVGGKTYYTFAYEPVQGA